MSPRLVRLLSALVAFGTLSVACTRTPPGGEIAFYPGAAGGGAAAPVAVDDAGVAVGPSDAAVDGTTGGGTDGLPASSGAGGGSAGGMTGAGGGAPATGGAAAGGTSTPTGTADPGETRGVTPAGGGRTGGTVKFVYHTQLEDCGDDPTTANQGTANEKGLAVLAEWVKWFNKEVLPQVGWQLEYEVVDDGGPFCPEKAQAAALKIVKDLKPFAAIGGLTQPARGPVVADAVTRAGIVHIGNSWSVARPIRERAPYAWPTNAVGERLLENLVAWMEQRVKGTKVAFGPGGTQVDRVYGIVAVDTGEGRELGGAVRQYMLDAGMQPHQMYFISGDSGVAAQQASNTALKMQQDGINTLVFALPYPSAVNSSIVLTEAMNSQNYLPEIMIGNYGLALFDSLHNKRVWANARGTSQMPALVLRWAVAPDSNGNLSVVEEYDEIPENESGYIKVWNEKLGHNDQPQDSSVPPAYDTWTQLSLLVTGLLHLDGPLTAENWARAVHSARFGGPNRCTVGRFMVRDYFWSSGFHWEYGASGLRAKSTSVYWVNEQTPMGSNGFYESYDNYRFYGAEEWPGKHTRDTGQEGVDIPKQKRIGIRPWTPCSKFPNYPVDSRR